jgi:hypothetical protein
MATKPFIAEKGFMTQVLGSVATLAIAAPIVDGSRSETGLTDAGRIGFYFDRTTSNEKVGVVVKGTEILSVGYVSGNATVRVIGYLDPIGETVAGNWNTIIGAGADHGSPLTAIYCTLVGAESYAESGVQDTIVMGDYAQAWSSQQVVLGSGAVAWGTAAGGIAIGALVTLPAGSAGTVLIGYEAICGTGVGNAVVIGRTASVGATNAIAIGYQMDASGISSVAVGNNGGAGAINSIAIGDEPYVDATATAGITIGKESGVLSGAIYGIALGALAGVGTDDAYSIALGYYAATTAAHQLVLGSTTGYVDDIAVGAGDTDNTGTSGLVTTIRASNRSAGSGTARGLRLRSGAGSSGASNGSVYLNVGGTDVVTVSRASATGGTVSIAQGTITNPSVMLSGTATWSSAPTTFTAWKLNVTDTNSASASLLLDLQVGGSSKFSVSKAGKVVIADRTETAASTTARAGLNIAPGTAPTSPTDGDVWTTGSGMFVQIGGSSYDLLTGIGELGTSTTVSSSTTIVNRKTAFTGSTASQTLTMPVGTSRSEYCITNDATVSVSIAPGVGQTIEGLATLLMLPGDSAYFALVGTDWKVIA